MNGMRAANWVVTAWLLVVTGHAASAATLETLTFSGATFAGGGTVDGYFTYDYAANTVPTLTSFDITTTPGGGAPGFSYVLNVSGKADTVSQYSIDDYNFSLKAYEAQIFKPGGALYLDWTGIGAQAALRPDLFSLGMLDAASEPYDNGHSNRFMDFAGTSIGYQGTFVVVPAVPDPGVDTTPVPPPVMDPTPVPEPASAALLLAGVVSLVANRRRAALPSC